MAPNRSRQELRREGAWRHQYHSMLDNDIAGSGIHEGVSSRVTSPVPGSINSSRTQLKGCGSPRRKTKAV
ncbi:hypothetical protein [Myxococcus eversor]|uniref:hypothetical protein n=1 Tax=Myxococcus eversor TaxID=2709661 RepID=UPI0013D61DFC|nr:hypothetical protein [Myxococcus eversor]